MIKVGYLTSYDYYMLLTSINQLYNEVDKIYVAIDNDRKTWSGSNFELPQSFFDEINEFDKLSKIEFYFDNFYISDLSPMNCETRERNLLLKKMGKGWLIQLDVDEYVYDFKVLSKYLKKHWYLNLFPKLTPVVFRGILVTLFRELSDGYLYIENNERFSFVTNYPHYEITRNNRSISNHMCDVKVIHQSWARSEEQIQLKIKNWGHRDDFDTQKYFNFWKNLNSSNYQNYKNIHPMNPIIWDELHYLPAKSIDEFIISFSKNNPQKLVPVSLLKISKAFFRKCFKINC